ncbi:MAG: hypothetical protein ACTS22_07095 [Phycisphaerales bacterium]
MSSRSTRRLGIVALAIPLAAGCDDPLAGDRPNEVRVQRIITLSGERIVSYTAFYDDGLETYIDLAPAGDPDMITVERETIEDGSLITIVRAGAPVDLPADGPAPLDLDEHWRARFEAIDAMVDADRVPWSDAHGVLTPQQIERASGG